MFNIVLYQPEIPPNTGNIMRLCANTGAMLHLIEPLGFDISDKQLKRANLDYEMFDRPKLYASFEDYIEYCKKKGERKDHFTKENYSLLFHSTIYLCSTKARTLYSNVHYQPGDTFVFGPETKGLPLDLLNQYPDQNKITIPMQKETRSLNLSNAVAIIIYEAWRQVNFKL